jgi:hypothetical protein
MRDELKKSIMKNGSGDKFLLVFDYNLSIDKINNIKKQWLECAEKNNALILDFDVVTIIPIGENKNGRQ